MAAGAAAQMSEELYQVLQAARESGDRLELRMSGREFGTLAEGDKGKLTFQGTRYRGFERRLM